MPYRVATFVILTGALVLAAGVSSAFEDGDFTAVTAGYVVMRIAMILQWLRAAASDPPRRPAARRYALGIGVLQLGWVALLFVPSVAAQAGFGLLVLLELLVPIWAETAAPTSWHAQHIAERYGLLTIIVLGESVLAATVGIQTALAAGESATGLAALIGGGLLTLFSMWWLYFERPVHGMLTDVRRGFIWGYGHFLVFASAAAVGAGLAVAVEHATGHGVITDRIAAFAVAVPVAIYLVVLWFLHHKPGEGELPHLGLLAALLVLVAPLLPGSFVLIGLIVTALIAARLVTHRIVHQHEPA